MLKYSAVRAGRILGAVVHGLNISQPMALAAPIVDELRSALLRHRVLVIPKPQDVDTAEDFNMTEDAMVDFFSLFGKPLPQQGRELVHGGRPEIFKVTNMHNDEATKRTSAVLGDAELLFHSDLSYRHEPGIYSALHAVVLPESNNSCDSVVKSAGATIFADLVAAYDALPSDIKMGVSTMKAVHRHPEPHMNNAEGTEVVHPVVRIHPETLERCLYVSPMMTTEIIGVSQAESDEILAYLYDHCDKPEFHYQHDWEIHDTVIWDNRSTLHRRLPFRGSRLLWRTQSRGDPPSNEVSAA